MRLLIVEDDQPIAASLQRTLRRSGNVVDVSVDGESALNAIGGADYDCVILDLGLPDMDGTDVLRRVRSQNQQTPVVILTAREDPADRVVGLDLGADDYVPKPFNLNELEARIRAVTRRAIARRGDDICIGQLRLSMSEKRVYIQDQATPLLPREFAVLECLLLRHGRVVSKRKLLEQIISWDDDLSETAVELYVHRVRRKIEGSGCVVRTLRGFGYLLQSDSAQSS
jgi:two-component system, OmpR family, response regulator